MSTSKALLLVAILLCGCSVKPPKKSIQQPLKTTSNSDVEEAEVVFEEVMPVEETKQSTQSLNPLGFEPVKNIQFNEKYGISNSLNEQYDLSWEKNSTDKYNRQGLVDKNGNVILPHIFTKKYGTNNNYELMLAIGNTQGLYNLNELRWSIPIMYDELSNLANNLYLAKKDNKWGVIDDNNSIVVPFEWSQVQRISGIENYVLVTRDQLNGVFSIMEKKLTVPCIYSSLKKLERQNNFLARQGSRSNILDISNQPLFKRWYDEVRQSSLNSDFYIVKENSRYGVIDNNEKVIVPIEYTEFSDNAYSDGSYLAKNKEGKYGFMLIDGRVTLPFKYDNVRRGYNNNVVSVLDGKCGLVQVNAGAPFEIVTCEFDNIVDGTKTFIVEKGGKFGLLNQLGKQMTPVEYQSLELFKDYDNLTIYIAKKNKSYCLISEQGKVSSDVDFTELTPLYRASSSSYYNQKFTYLKARVKNGKCGIMDRLGKMIVAPQFEDIVAEDDNLVIVRANGKCGMYSMIGQKLIVAHEYDQIIRSTNKYIGFAGKNIDFLVIKSDQVTKINTVK